MTLDLSGLNIPTRDWQSKLKNMTQMYVVYKSTL